LEDRLKKAADFIRAFFRTRLIPQLAKLVTISQFSPMKFASLEPESVVRTRATVTSPEMWSAAKETKGLETMDAYQSFEGTQHDI
jgi:hypothetical protein